MELSPPLHLGVEAIKKEAFGSLSTSVGQLTNFQIYIYIYIYTHEVFKKFPGLIYKTKV